MEDDDGTASGAARQGLRRRPELTTPPKERMSVRQRAQKAAYDVVKNGMNPSKAASKWGVSRTNIYYYKKELVASGVCTDASVDSQIRPEDSVSNINESILSNKSDNWEKYVQACTLAGELVPKLGRKAAALEATKKFGVSVSASTAYRMSKNPELVVVKPGRKLIIPSTIEKKLVDLCLAVRQIGLPIFRFMVMNYVNTLIADTPIVQQLKDKEVKRHWYYNWLNRSPELTTGNIRPLEMSRAQWATPENIKQHYDMVADMMVKLKLAEPDPNYDPTVERSVRLRITKPERIASMDETRLTNDTTEKNKSKSNRSIIGKDDAREVFVNKGGGDGTAIGGSTMDGRDLPGVSLPHMHAMHMLTPLLLCHRFLHLLKECDWSR